MDYYGITNKGSFIIEKLATLPAWGASDEGRIVYAEDVNTLYYGTDTKWQDLGGGGASRDISQGAHGFVVGTPLYLNSTTYTKAQADSEAKAEVVGMVSGVVSAGVFTLTNCGWVGGITPSEVLDTGTEFVSGSMYYLDEVTAGKITLSEPALLTSVNKPIFIADSTTSGYFFNMRGVANSDPSVGYGAAFVDGDLSSGILTVNHNLGSKYVVPIIYNNSGNKIEPDEFTAVTLNQMTVDLTSYGTLTGSWYISILSVGATITYPISTANGGFGKALTPALGKVVEGDGTTFVANYRPLTNLLTNSGFGVWSNGTLENVGSDLVTNGSDWTGASGSTPPTGWTVKSFSGSGGTTSFSNAGGYLTMGNDNCGISLEQGITTVIGKLYKFSVSHKNGTGIGKISVYSGINFSGTELASNYALNDADWAVTTLTFEAITTTTYIHLINNNSYDTLFDSVTLYEVTPGCVAADNLACDGWYKEDVIDCWREHNGTNTKAGSFYSLKLTSGTDDRSFYWPLLSIGDNSEFYKKFAGRSVCFGAWVKTSTASRVKLKIRGATQSFSSYHTGGGDWEWLEVIQSVSESITYFNVSFNLFGTSGDVYISQPMLVYGSSIGEGNYQPIPNEVICLETVITSALSGTGKSDQVATTYNIEADTNGKLPKGIKAIDLYCVVNDSGSAGATDDGRVLIQGNTTSGYFCASCAGLANDAKQYQMGRTFCDGNGDCKISYYATGSGTLDVVLDYIAVQL